MAGEFCLLLLSVVQVMPKNIFSADGCCVFSNMLPPKITFEEFVVADDALHLCEENNVDQICKPMD